MGEADIQKLFEIYEYTKFLKKRHELQFNFKVDEGRYETAIEFKDGNVHHPPFSKDWSDKPTIFCPDLLDFENKIIIEYEEEIGNKRPGAKLAKKGHNREGDMPNKRDARRNEYYQKNGFSYFQIWESDRRWKVKLENFLVNFNPK